MDELPEIVPIFPLPNVVLFPDVDLPLHIFEPRYREMVSDAMEGDRLIGMTLLRGDWRKDYHGAPEIFPVGCVGRIVDFHLLPDGRSNLLLRGLRCFEIVAEVGGRAYRRARVRWRARASAEGTSGLAGVGDRLRASVTRLLARSEGGVPQDLWGKLPTDVEKLINALAFALELAAIEKLALLECPDAATRSERLLEIIEFRLADRGFGPSGTRQEEEPWH